MLDLARLHIEGAAGQVDLRTLLGHHVLTAEGHRTALGHPLANAVVTGAQITAHFQQAACGVPAVGGIAIGASRDKNQVADIHPHIVVIQGLVVAIDRRIALLVALDIDLDAIGRHRHLDPGGAGHVDHRAVAHQGALRSLDTDLAASGQGHGTAAKIHRAVAGDFHQGLVTAVGIGRHNVAVLIKRRRHQPSALAVEGAAAVEQNRAEAALAQGHASVVARALYMQGTPGFHRRTGK